MENFDRVLFISISVPLLAKKEKLLLLKNYHGRMKNQTLFI